MKKVLEAVIPRELRMNVEKEQHVGGTRWRVDRAPSESGDNYSFRYYNHNQKWYEFTLITITRNGTH